MVAQWKVIHRFSAGVEVQNPIPAYKNLAVSLQYEGDKLIGIEHELDCEDELEPRKVIDRSRRELMLFLELLRYRRGISLPNITSVVQKVEPATSSPRRSTGAQSVDTDALLCAPILMPDPKVFSHTPARLLDWLRLANDASDSDEPAYAIRNYYMIWEDSHPSWKPKDGPDEANDLRLTRHFVSHGGKLRKETCEFVESNLGKPIECFDPTDSYQQQFISSQRRPARSLIEAELDKELNKLL